MEIVQGKFSIELQVTNLIEHFYSNSNSISVKTSKTKGMTVAVLLNSKGFMIISLGKVVKKLHEIKLEHDKPADRNFFSLITDLSELEDDRFSMTFFVYYEATLKAFYCEFDLENGCQKFHLKKTFSKQLKLVNGIKFNKNIVLAICEDFEVVYIGLKDLAIIGKTRIASNTISIKRIHGALLVKTSSAHRINDSDLDNGFWIVESYTIEEYVKNIINNGHYISALNLSLSLTKRARNLFLFKSQTLNDEKLKAFLVTVSRSYYKFIIYNQALDRVTKDSFKILIEYLYKADIMEVLNEIHTELTKNSLQNSMVHLFDAMIEFISENHYYKFDHLQPEWLLKLIEILFLKERRWDIFKLVMRNSFKKIADVTEVVLILKTLELKLPIIKLIVEDEQTDEQLLMALYTIYIKQKQVPLFGQLIVTLIKTGFAFGYQLSPLSPTQTQMMSDFFIRKEVLEVFVFFRSDFIGTFSDLYALYFHQYLIVLNDENKFNDSLIYNFFMARQTIPKPFNFFFQVFDRYDFADVKQIDFLFALCAMDLFSKHIVSSQALELDIVDLILSIVFKGTVEYDCGDQFTEIIVNFFRFLDYALQSKDESYQAILGKYVGLLEPLGFSQIVIEIDFLRRNFIKGLELWIKKSSKMPKFDIFDWLHRIYARFEQSELAQFTKFLLKNLSVLVKVSQAETSKLLYSIQELSLKDIEYLKPYPELIILKIQQELSTGVIVDVELQSLYVSLLFQRNPRQLIYPVKNFRMDLENVLKFANKVNDQDLQLVLRSKLGYEQGAKDILLAHLERLVNTSDLPTREISKHSFTKFYFVMQEFIEMLERTQRSESYFETFSRLHEIINKAEGLRDLDYWKFKSIANHFFMEGLAALKGEGLREMLKKIDHFIQLDTSLIKILLENARKDARFSQLVSRICVLDSLAAGDKLQSCLHRGRSSADIITRNKYQLTKTKKQTSPYHTMYLMEQNYAFRYLND